MKGRKGENQGGMRGKERRMGQEGMKEGWDGRKPTGGGGKDGMGLGG